jgi:hypothetical protein
MNFSARASIAVALIGMAATASMAETTQTSAAACPFDNGGSTLENDGLVLTRYALGLRGATMVANTSFAVGDTSTIESNIACPSCGLRVTDDKDALNNPIFTVADATIISRKLAGFSGPALTNGIALGSGTRNTPAAVQSFLLAGCGATGGTVTSVATGPGLTGGAITGAGTIGLDATQRLPIPACADSQTVLWNATSGNWICAGWTPPVTYSLSTVENLRMLRGTIVNGFIGQDIYGAGFAVTNTFSAFPDGRYTITFNVPFPSVPTVTASSNCSFAQATRITSISNTLARLETRNSAGSLESNCVVSFIVVGPQ